MSIWPKRSTAPPTTPSMSSRTVTSPRMKCPRSPAFISFSAFAPFSGSRPLITTRAPSARKASPMPRPIPVLPLVMTATRPSSFPMLAFLWLGPIDWANVYTDFSIWSMLSGPLRSGGFPAVRDQQRPGDEARLGGYQEAHRRGDLLRLGHPFEQVALAE